MLRGADPARRHEGAKKLRIPAEGVFTAAGFAVYLLGSGINRGFEQFNGPSAVSGFEAADPDDEFFDNRISVQIWRRPPRGGVGQMRR